MAGDTDLTRIVRYEADTTKAISQLDKLTAASSKTNAGLDTVGGKVDAVSSKLDSMSAGVAGFGKGLALGLVGGGFVEAATKVVEGIKSIVDAMDELDESAEGIGISVEKLQELRYAAVFTGTSAEDLNSALVRLTDKMSNIESTTDNAARILRAVGITSKDTAEDGMKKLADAFANTEDPTRKLAIAVELFGRQLGPSMVRFLSQGAEGLNKMAKEAHQAAVIMNEETIKAAADLNDNLDKMKLLAGGAAGVIAGPLIKSLSDLSKQMVDNVAKMGLWQGGIKNYWVGVRAFWGIAEKGAKDAEEAIDKVTEKTGKKGPALPPANIVKPEKGEKPKDEWAEWTKSIEKAGETAELVPRKIAFLEEQIAKTNTTTHEGRLRLEALNKALESLKVPDAADKALKAVGESITKLEDAPYVIERLTEKMLELERAGKQGGLAWEEYSKARDKALAEQDVTGAVRAVQKVQEAVQEAGYLQARIDAINQAVAAGTISEAWGERYKNQIQGIADEAKKTNDLVKSIGDLLGKSIVDFTDSMIENFGKAGASFDKFIEDMLKAIAKLLINAQFKKFAESLGGTEFGDWFGIKPATKTAHGAAWNAQGVEFMASGGILSRPTFFSNGGRLAVAGEAGPEAVVPLQRTATGDLGVAASPTTINVINNHPDAAVKPGTRTNSDGSRIVEITIEQKVKSMIANGSLDKTMRGSYGLSRQPAAG